MGDIGSPIVGKSKLAQINKHPTIIQTIRAKNVLSLINNELSKITKPFSSCDIEFIYTYEAANYKDSEKEFISEYKDKLKLNRSIDAEIHKTSIIINTVSYTHLTLQTKA